VVLILLSQVGGSGRLPALPHGYRVPPTHPPPAELVLGQDLARQSRTPQGTIRLYHTSSQRTKTRFSGPWCPSPAPGSDGPRL